MAGASVAPKSARIAPGGGQLSGHWSENEGQFRVELQDKVTKIKYEYLKNVSSKMECYFSCHSLVFT